MSTEALKALEACANQFAFYAEEHRKAGKIEKAETNERFRDMARAALTQASEPVCWTSEFQFKHLLAGTGDSAGCYPVWRHDHGGNIPLFTSSQPPTKASEPVGTEPRFFIDHETIHDRVTGKHVVTNGVWPYDDTVEMVCEFLNSLTSPQPPAPDSEADILKSDLQADRNYRNGLMAGWNFGVVEDRAGFDAAIASLQKEIVAASKTLKATTPAPDSEAVTYSQAEFDEAHEIGKREGYESAVQDIDLLTGGDGEYRYCLGAEDSDRHTPDAEAMKARIVERFEAANNIGDELQQALFKWLAKRDLAPDPNEEWYVADVIASLDLHEREICEATKPVPAGEVCGSSSNIKTVCRSDSGQNDHQTTADTVVVSREDLVIGVSCMEAVLEPWNNNELVLKEAIALARAGLSQALQAEGGK